jgi:hypothetical protein
MKDLTKYIESLLDGLEKPYVVNYVDEVYCVDIIFDHQDNINLGGIMNLASIFTVNKTVSLLKTYLPERMFKVGGKHINVPIELNREFKYDNLSVQYNSGEDIFGESNYVVDYGSRLGINFGSLYNVVDYGSFLYNTDPL